ncbi:MAG: hypothetical protein ONA90_08775, partial [candidate division KSB1 bacterium]|nr:hypothetical protein [candidate division KSB1 bacterium]
TKNDLQRKTNGNEREWVDFKEGSQPTNWVGSCFQIDLMKPAILKIFFIAVLFSLQNLGTNFSTRQVLAKQCKSNDRYLNGANM